MTRLSIAIIAAVIGGSSPVAAQSLEDVAACTPDALRFCRHLGQGATILQAISCLNQHRARLRPQCRKVLEKFER